ncbi:hypothetical protein M3J09_010645 [Ascochyta lentis]
MGTYSILPSRLLRWKGIPCCKYGLSLISITRSRISMCLRAPKQSLVRPVFCMRYRPTTDVFYYSYAHKWGLWRPWAVQRSRLLYEEWDTLGQFHDC